MGTVRTLTGLAVASSTLMGVLAHAQLAPPSSNAAQSYSLPGTRGYLGLTVGRGTPEASCPTTALVCEQQDRSAKFYAGTMIGRNWGAEVAYIDMGRLLRAGTDTRVQGLNLSLVGRKQLFSSFGVYGKVGTTYGRTDSTAVMGNISAAGQEQGFGLSFGGGVSYEITPRLSATLEWDSHDLRFAGGTRDPVRSTNLGLQFRY